MNQRQKFDEAGLGRIADDLLRLSRNCVRIAPKKTNGQELGASRFDGTPDLPAGIEWPLWKDAPLGFIGQIHLPDVIGLDDERLLPETGTLYFFYDFVQQPWGFDPEHRGCCRVFYNDGPASDLRNVSMPENLAQLASCSLKFSRVPSLPSLFDPQITALALTDGESDDYSDYWIDLGANGPDHHLLGYPNQIQGEMQLECQLVSHGLYCGDPAGYQDPRASALEAGATDWQLLLQVDSDETELDIMWGDVGMIYFWIRRQDLLARDFSQVWLVLQCY